MKITRMAGALSAIRADDGMVFFLFRRRYLPRMASSEIEALIQALARLPGLGPRSARRAVLHLMKRRETAMAPLLRALTRVNESLSVCAACGNVDTSDPCGICADPRRDTRLLCV